MTADEARAIAAEVVEQIGRPTPPLLDANEAGGLLNVPASWILAEARAGRIPHVRLGKYVRFKTDELNAWLDGRAVGPRRRERT